MNKQASEEHVFHLGAPATITVKPPTHHDDWLQLATKSVIVACLSSCETKSALGAHYIVKVIQTPTLPASLLHTSTMYLKSALVASILATATAFAPSNINVAQRSVTSTNTALNVAIDTSDIKNGLTVEIDGEPYKVLNFSIMKQARGAAKTTIKFKNLKRGNTIENTYRSGEKFETAMIEKKPHIFSYSDESGNFFYMDSETFEEVMVEANLMEDVAKWIDEGMEVNLIFFKGQVIEVGVPSTDVYEIVETEPSLKGNTANAHTKPAVLSSGATVTIPGFIEQGTKIKVDTEKAEYLERA